MDMGTAACMPTTYVPGQLGFQTFGMGFVANTGDAGETLFVAESTVTHAPEAHSPAAWLDRHDRAPAALRRAVLASHPGPRAHRHGDGSALRLLHEPRRDGLAHREIDPVTGALLVDYPLMVGTPNDA